MATLTKPAIKVDKVKFKKYSTKYTISFIRLVFLIGMSFVVLFPLFQKLVYSIMSSVDLTDATVSYIPKNVTFENFKSAWTTLGGLPTFLRTLGLTVTCSLLAVTCATVTGYGLARFKFKLNSALFGLVILALVLPSDLLFTPRYIMFAWLDETSISFAGTLSEWFGTTVKPVSFIGSSWIPMLLFSATCTGLKSSLYIFLMRQFFKGQPHELEEAAYVDGAGPFRTFYSIMLPGAVSMMITVFLFSFVFQWLDDSFTTIFMSQVELISTKYGDFDRDWSDNSALNNLNKSLTKSAGVVIIIAPLVALYAFTQRYFVESISRSGLVG